MLHTSDEFCFKINRKLVGVKVFDQLTVASIYLHRYACCQLYYFKLISDFSKNTFDLKIV